MSKRNSQDAKRAARERLRAERERQAKKDRAKRQLLVAASVVGALVVVGGIGTAVAVMNGKDSSGDDMAVTMGGAKAEKTIDIYEDLRCPACAQFEQAMGDTLKKGADQGKFKLRVHLGSIIDNNMGGSGSKNAARALGAAKAVSMDAFTEYHKLLYSAKYHPQEQDDKFADNKYLLKVADEVPELKDNTAFEKAVKSNKYNKWAKDMIASFNGANVESTPTVKIDGEQIEPQNLPGELKKMGVDLKAGGEDEKSEKDSKDSKGSQDSKGEDSSAKDSKDEKDSKGDKGAEDSKSSDGSDGSDSSDK
ncbi:thioredoxin domain-containing protein [Streptomyces sp. NRRL S-1868]|uniref:thioredoxin domain-containing protein n=1 Tax=Streptomyces sp. NRRL S-1868 TaxID=1463892 RepID=UPI000A65D812|nr:thioredoxin domain-containing protein [Streptomyces sp. NRRL S-1868]